jgi:hypothetical protein
MTRPRQRAHHEQPRSRTADGHSIYVTDSVPLCRLDLGRDHRPLRRLPVAAADCLGLDFAVP